MGYITIAGRVKAGAHYLDRATPGWYREVDLDQLSMVKTDRCVLAQLDGGYYRGLDRFGDALEVVETLGFTTDGSDDAEWDTLTAYWVAEIRRRLARAPEGVAA
jgi:hypothetical protein